MWKRHLPGLIVAALLSFVVIQPAAAAGPLDCGTTASPPGVIKGSDGSGGCSDLQIVNHALVTSASIAGFTPNGNAITAQSVTSSTANIALPAGTVVLVQNVGTTNGLTFKLGTANTVTATANDIYVGPGAGCTVTVGSNTWIAFKTATSTTTLNVTGGAGLGACPTGGGSGGGGGAATVADGADVAEGTTTDAKVCTDATGTLHAYLRCLASNSGGVLPLTVGISGVATATGQIGCQSSIPYDASTNGSTQLVALASSQTVYVCGYMIWAAGTVNVELDYGTGTACATGNNKITPAFQLVAQSGAVDRSMVYQGLKTAASNELCIKTSAGVPVQAIVYYTQF